MRFNVKNTKTMVVVIAVVLVLLIGAVGILAVRLNKSITTKTIPATAYGIGSIDDSGKVVKSSEHIYTKDYITVDGLKVTVKEKADVQYKLYFYDADKTFLSTSLSWLAKDFDGVIPESAKYVRVVISPVDDTEVTILEIIGYANQLTVTVNK